MFRSHLAQTRRFLLHVYQQWDRLDIPKMSASLTFYSIVALAPLMVIFLAAAALAFGSAAAQDHLVRALRLEIGNTGAGVIQTLLARSSSPELGTLATLLGAVALFLGATGVFVELKGSLRVIWGMPETGPNGLLGLLKERVVSFAMVLITGVVLVLSILVSISLSMIHEFAGNWVPESVGRAAGYALSFAVSTTVFGMVYRIVPPERLPWRHIAFGAAITAVLFGLGKAVIATYLGSVAAASTYGAAGSLFAFLLWLYYSSQVFLIGAVITRSRNRVARIGEAAGTGDVPTPTPASLNRAH
ncbi:MAG: YihY/virulence factor BrkB family protein [Acidobacteriota bacterium]